MHDTARFAVTLTGIGFALVLIAIQFGLFLGFTTATSNNIDHSKADLWMVFPGVAVNVEEEDRAARQEKYKDG